MVRFKSHSQLPLQIILHCYILYTYFCFCLSGIRAGIFVRDAKALCPHLVILPYNFEAYEEVVIYLRFSFYPENCLKEDPYHLSIDFFGVINIIYHFSMSCWFLGAMSYVEKFAGC